MRKIILTNILILQCVYGFTQTLYTNYLDMSSEWRYLSGGWNGFSGYSNYNTTYFDGVETINGIVYYKRYSKDQYNSTDFQGNTISTLTLSNPVYFREDVNGKFYYINPNTNLEQVYFDNQSIINAQVGDLFPYPGAVCNVQSTETIYLGATPLKKINGTVLSSTTGNIEGIGVIGLACAIGIESGGNLSCYSKQGINIQFGTTNCNSFPIPVRVNLIVNSNNFTENEIKVYPNPTNGIFKLNISNDSLNKSYKLYDTQGILLKEFLFTDTEEIIDISNYSNGIYILKTTGQNVTDYKKIIKK